MLSERVDQNAICAISEGKKSFQKEPPQPTVPFCVTMGPRPPALLVIQTRRKSATSRTKGAAQFSNRRMAFMPRMMMAMLRIQKTPKLSQRVQCWPASIDDLVQLSWNRAPARVYRASPPIQGWL